MMNKNLFNDETVRKFLSVIRRDEKPFNVYIDGERHEVQDISEAVNLVMNSDSADVNVDINDVNNDRFCYIKISVYSKDSNEAADAANSIVRFLGGMFFSNPVCARDGDRPDLIYYAYMRSNYETDRIINNFETVLNIAFGSNTCNIEVHSDINESCRLYGCGDSDVVSFPDGRMSPCQAYVRTVSEMLDVKPLPSKLNNYNPEKFDVGEFLVKNGVGFTRRDVGEFAVYDLNECIIDRTHGSACLVKNQDGAIWYCCKSAKCDERWNKIVKRIEKKKNDADKIIVNNRNSGTMPSEVRMPSDDEIANMEEMFGKEMLDVFDLDDELDNEKSEFIKSGYGALDEALEGGFSRGQVVIVTGATSGGKTTFTSNMALNFMEQGLTVAHYSGELPGRETWRWFAGQAAGPLYVRYDDEKNGYATPKVVRDAIKEWIRDTAGYYVYNNAYGMNFNRIFNAIIRMCVEKKADVAIVDNIMSVDASEIGQNELDAQKNFMLKLSWMAKNYNILVIVIAHPGKSAMMSSGTLISKSGISGSQHIVDAADVVIAMYKITDEFKRVTHDVLKFPDGHVSYSGTNALNIIKSRYTSCEDLWIPLWYCRKSKRMKQSLTENRHYGWETKEAVSKIAEVEDRSETPYDCLPGIAFGSQKDWVKSDSPVENANPSVLPGVWVHSEEGINEYYDSNGTHMPRSVVAEMYHDMMRWNTKSERKVKYEPIPGQIGVTNKFENIEKAQVEAYKRGISDCSEVYIPDDIDQEMPFEEPDKSVVDKDKVKSNIDELKALIDNCIYSRNVKKAKMFATTSWHRWVELANKGDSTCAETLKKVEKIHGIMKYVDRNWRGHYEDV